VTVDECMVKYNYRSDSPDKCIRCFSVVGNTCLWIKKETGQSFRPNLFTDSCDKFNPVLPAHPESPYKKVTP
jgi:hypothetical protein